VNLEDVFESADDRDFYLKVPKFDERKENDGKEVFEGFKKKLSQCTSKEVADGMAEEFFRIASKQNRKLLVDGF
jgi:hypothetical protein